ncbi:MAG: trehalose/maltose transport system permease protein, partial [Thermomicrobiales bacterium]|nr:trehalose/maltose transport system permease protein [Thermomicrobiales bacterium]
MSQQVVAAPVAKPKWRRWGGASDAPESAWGKARERLAWTLVAPSVLVVAVVALYPLFQTFRLSFTNQKLASNDPWRYVGFAQYEFLLRNDGFQRAFRNTVVFTISSVAIETVLGVVVALIINSQFKGRGLLRTAMLVPWAIPTVVSARLWEYMYHGEYGVLNDLLVNKLPQLIDWIPFVGGTLASIFPSDGIAFTARPNTAMAAIVAVDVWKTTPFMALLILAGLQIIPGDIYEASTVDGASKWQQFWQMTLPMLRPALLVALIFRTLDAFRVFDVIYVMRGVAVETVSLAIFAQQTLVNEDRLGQTSAASVIIFACIGVL